MLRIDIKEEVVAEFQRTPLARTTGVETQHRIGAITMMVDKIISGLRLARCAVECDRQPGKGVCSDFLLMRAQLAPCDIAVAVIV